MKTALCILGYPRCRGLYCSGMDILQAEINRKRKLNAEVSATLANNTKYLRQSDLRRLEEERRRQAQEELDRKRGLVVDKSTSECEEPTSDTLADDATENSLTKDALKALSTDEVRKELRNLGEPVTLFGESDAERIDRCVEARASNADTRHENSFRLQSSTRDADEKSEASDTNKKTSAPLTVITHFSDDSSLTPTKVVYKYFRNLMKIWDHDLSNRTDAEKNSARGTSSFCLVRIILIFAGKMEIRTYKQCKDYIKPLFKLCKQNEVPVDILENLSAIVRFCEAGDFRSAHDRYSLFRCRYLCVMMCRYLRAAIGNAAWPIGLTMVGIHERTGREKISTSKVAHVMNNERERKYFTSVKRLMTFAQNKRPDIDPSMKVL